MDDQVVISPTAGRQLEDMFDHSVRQWGVDQARKYTDAIIATLMRLHADAWSGVVYPTVIGSMALSGPAVAT